MESFKEYLNRKPPTDVQIAQKKHLPKSKIDKELEKGTKDETEHTTKKNVAQYIARMHVGQHPDYYERLNKAHL
jgi:hypothetical protein